MHIHVHSNYYQAYCVAYSDEQSAVVVVCQVESPTESLEEQYQTVRKESNRSNVMQYGDMVQIVSLSSTSYSEAFRIKDLKFYITTYVVTVVARC